MVYISKERQAKPPLLFHYFTAADICTDISDIPFSLLVLHLIMFTQFQLRLQPQTVAHMKTETGQIYTDRWNGFLYFKKKYR